MAGSTKLLTSSGGGVILTPATNIASDVTASIPSSTGTLGMIQNNIITAGTAVASTSGTSIDFTGIPAGVKRITVMLSGVSTSGSSNVIVRIGSGSIQSTGYIFVGTNAGTTNSTSGGLATDGFYIDIGSPTSASLRYGIGTLALLNSTTNLWVWSDSTGQSIGTAYYFMGGGGNVTLSGVLDRVRITTQNGTDTFDAGSVNIFWE